MLVYTCTHFVCRAGAHKYAIFVAASCCCVVRAKWIPEGARAGMYVCVCKSDIYKNVTELVGSIIVNKCVF